MKGLIMPSLIGEKLSVAMECLTQIDMLMSESLNQVKRNEKIDPIALTATLVSTQKIRKSLMDLVSDLLDERDKLKNFN